jgi:hypothetical protein
LVTTKDVPPGGAGEIKATFKSKGYNGPVTKTITVETNDPDHRTVRLTLKGKVTADVTVTPRFVNFGNVQRGEPAKPVPLTIEFRKGTQIRVKEVRSENPAVQVRRVQESDQGAEYSVSLMEKPPIGRVTGEITIETTSRKEPQIKVPVHALVQGSVKVSPQLLSLGLVSPGKPVTRQLTLTKTGGEKFTVKEVREGSSRLTCQVITEKEGEQYKIQVDYDPGDQKTGRIAERLTIVTKSGEEETVEVPVYGAIREAGPGAAGIGMPAVPGAMSGDPAP